MNQINSFRARLLIVAAVMLSGFSVLIFKLWYEQIHYGERYRKYISRQSVRRVRLPGLRGRILTSDYCLIADNVPSYNLVFYLQEMRRNSRAKTVENIRNIASMFSRELNLPDNLSREMIQRHINVTPGMPLVIYRNLSPIALARAYQLMPQLAGVGVEIEPMRHYPEGSMASLVIGFTRSEAAEDALDRNDYFYYRSDHEGRSGVELVFDKFAGDISVPGLQGFPGSELMQVDHLGYVNAHRLEYSPPKNGSNIVLTMDSRAQKIGEQLMEGKRGAMVLLNADTGDILALVSNPRIDLARITPVWSKEYYQELLLDPAKPMFNRAVSGSYMPGSIIKPIVALTALEHSWDPDKKIRCDGRTVVNGQRISCASSSHGELDLVEAIERSCNDYFIEMGLELGWKKLTESYSKVGIGELPGLEISNSRGLNPERIASNPQRRWTRFDTALISIGQGKVLVSPLQAARFTAVIANGGKLMETRLLKEVYDESGNLLFRNPPHISKVWNIKPEALELVRKGMFQVVNAPHGSGRRARSDQYVIYGKTGTAEVDTREGRIKNTWFTSFVTDNGNTYVLTILVEEGRSGGGDCAPLAKEFFERYLKGLL